MKKPNFDPTLHGFVLLKNYHPWGHEDVLMYEYGNHPCVDGSYSWLRENIYLSLALPDWVHIWGGPLEKMGMEVMLQNNGDEKPWNTESVQYFRGRIDSDAQAAEIIRALRLEGSNPLVLKPAPATDFAEIFVGRLVSCDPEGTPEERMRPAILQAYGQIGGKASPNGIERVWSKAKRNFVDHGHRIELDRAIFEAELARIMARNQRST